MRLATVLVALGFLTAPAQSRIWHIEPDGSGDASTIQAGIDSAAVGDTVLLADGTYTGTGNRDVLVSFGDIALISANRSPDMCIIDCKGTPQDPHRGFSILGVSGDGVHMEGLSIRNGYIPDSGGAILCSGSSLLLLNVYLEDNEAADNGGALYLSTGSIVEASRCVVSRNRADNGGGFWADESTIHVESVKFTENHASAGLYFGGAGVVWRSTALFTDVSFIGNDAGYGGGLFCYQSVSDLERCLFDQNVAHAGCGGMYSFAAGVTSAHANLTECEFTGNSAVVAAGAMMLSEFNAHIEGCLFQGNTANEAGGIYVNGFGDFIECRFEDNSAQQNGGALITEVTECEFRECVFIGNVAADEGGVLLSINGSTPLFTGCTMYGNRSTVGSAVMSSDYSTVELLSTIITAGEIGAAIACDATGAASLSCTDVIDNDGGDWVDCIADQYGTDGNFSTEPLFCDADMDDFTLRSDSPCLPGNHPDGYDCGVIGAFGEGCDEPTAVEHTSWGGVKSLFR